MGQETSFLLILVSADLILAKEQVYQVYEFVKYS